MKKTGKQNITGYYLSVFLLVLVLASIRSAPVYGKLDFLMIDNKPWWPEWRGAIEDLLEQGNQTILTDPTSATVLSGVFCQKTEQFRIFKPRRFLNIRELNLRNRAYGDQVPYYIFPLLLTGEPPDGSESGDKISSIDKLLAEIGEADSRDNHPYRCFINMHGFQYSWVPRETRHWLTAVSHTPIWYHYDGMRGSTLKQRLRDRPLENCTVFY